MAIFLPIWIIWPIVIFNKKVRITIILAVAAFELILYNQVIHIPEKEKNLQKSVFNKIRDLCNIEIKNTSDLVEVDGFLDEGAALRKRSLLKLFSERALNFIEIKVNTIDGKQFIAYPDGSSEGMWEVSRMPGSYVRVELSEKGDPNCISSPYNREIDRPPFLPNTCLKMTYPESSQAKFVLKLETNHPNGENFGYWTLVEKNNEKKLAALTTFVKQGKDFSNGGKYINASQIGSLEEPRIDNCSAPHTALSDRLVGVKGQWTGNSKVLDRKEIFPGIKPAEINNLEGLKEIKATEELFFYSEADYSLLFNPESEYEAWEISVNDAKKKGWSNFGTQLLDWKKHQLISLIPIAKNNSHPWVSLAFEKGFFVFSTGTPWQDRDKPRRNGESNLLIRYSSEGSFLWAARILPPSGDRIDPKCSFYPRSISADQENIILSANCTKLYGDQIKIPGKDESGLMWKIPIKNFPGKI